MKTNINRSSEVVKNLRTAFGDSGEAYAYAFGYAWAMMSEKNRIALLKLAQEKANEKENENA